VELNIETRHLFAYVPQGNTIISGTIAENMRMARENATDEEIVEALKIACAWDFVSLMPKGIDSDLGERGRGLSEGQAQRIAIARALLRKGNILLLDEATSALDLLTERQLLNNLIEHNLRQEVRSTLIFITHRPAVVEHCSQVITLQRCSVS
jgi:ABC-type bacteriocin/lantibiotic exporter with double-glycine peptidase domain